jgi:hypothetical protein
VLVRGARAGAPSVSEAAPGRPFGRARTILPDLRSFSLDRRAGKPLLLYQEDDGQQDELAPPYATPASVGALRGEGWFDGEDFSGHAFAGDGHGHELLVDSEIAVSARAPGGTFGVLHKLAAPAGSDCGISARMNRRIAVLAWNCGNEQQGTAQVAVLTRAGRLRALSRKLHLFVGGETPNVALDADGHWAVTWRADVENRFVALTGRGPRADRFRTVVPASDQTDAPEVAITRGGVAHVTWEDDRRRSVAVLESRLRIDGPAR